VKAKDPELLKGNGFFLRLLNVTQGLEEFRFDICREYTSIGSHSSNNNRTKDEEYPAFFTNFTPKKMNILSYIFNVPYQYALKPVLVKCGPTLKHLKISNRGDYYIEYLIDEILSLCPNLLSLHAASCIIRAGSDSSNQESSLPTGDNCPIYPLQYFRYYYSDKDPINSWLTKHCPYLKLNERTSYFIDHS